MIPHAILIILGEKVVITGFNGIGKSTLLKTLINQIPSLGGDFRFSEQVKIGYFEQAPRNIFTDKFFRLFYCFLLCCVLSDIIFPE